MSKSAMSRAIISVLFLAFVLFTQVIASALDMDPDKLKALKDDVNRMQQFIAAKIDADIKKAKALNDEVIKLQQAGRYEEAITIAKQVLQIYEENLGRGHPDTLQSLNNLAALYEKMGRYAEAEPLHKKALEITEKALSTQHPARAQSLNIVKGVLSVLLLIGFPVMLGYVSWRCPNCRSVVRWSRKCSCGHKKGQKLESVQYTIMDKSKFIEQSVLENKNISLDKPGIKDIVGYAQAVWEKKMDLTTAREKTIELGPDSSTIETLQACASTLMASAYDGAMIVSDLAFEASKRFSDDSQRLMSAFWLARSSRELGMFDRSFEVYQDAYESFSVVSTYFKIGEEQVKQTKRLISVGYEFFKNRKGHEKKFFKLEDGNVFGVLLSKIEINSPENQQDDGGANITRASVACCRLTPWIQKNKDIFRGADVSFLEKYISAGQNIKTRCVNVLALGKSFIEAEDFETAQRVLDFAGKALMGCSQNLYASHAYILAAYAAVHMGDHKTAGDFLLKIDESLLTKLTEIVLTVKADYAEYLLIKAVITTEEPARKVLIDEAKKHFPTFPYDNKRSKYLIVLHFAMSTRRCMTLMKLLGTAVKAF